MLVVLSVPDGQVAAPDGEAFGTADGTAIAGLATDGEDGDGASPLLRLL